MRLDRSGVADDPDAVIAINKSKPINRRHRYPADAGFSTIRRLSHHVNR